MVCACCWGTDASHTRGLGSRFIRCRALLLPGEGRKWAGTPVTQVVSLDDWMMLKRLVGATTFSRGRAYASRGAVKSRQCSEDGSLVTGEIQGSAGYPYATSVVVTRSPSSQQLTEIEGDCRCPVGIDCKHAVALLLSDGVNSPSSSPRQQLTGTRQTAA